MTPPDSSPKRIIERFDLPPSEAAEQELRGLRQAVGQALDRKRRLGHYAVVWEDGKVKTLPPESLPSWPETTAPRALVAQEPAPEEVGKPPVPPLAR